MNATVKQFLVILLCLLAAAPAIHHSQSATAIEGVVLEAATNRPLQGVRVSLMDSAEPEFVFGALPTVGSGAVTDDQGRFRIEAPAGRYRVVPAMDGYVFSRPERLRAPREPGVWISVSTDQRVEDVELRLVREGVIRGVVLDASGQTVPGGSAFLSRYRYNRYGVRQLSGIPGVYYPGSAYSFVRFNDRGEFRLYGLPPGDYYLQFLGGSSVFYPGTTDESKAVEIHLNAGEDKDLGTITLPPAEKKTPVRLRLMNGAEPISGGIVSIQYGNASMLILGRPGQEDVTVSLAPGFYDMVVATGMLGRQSLFARLSLQVGDSEIEQRVALRSGFRLATSLAMEDVGGQRPLAGVRCQLYQESPHALVNCYQDQLVVPGLYRLELNPPADAYIVSATISGRDVLRDGLELQADTELHIVLATPGAVLTGRVSSSNGEFLANAVVALVPDVPLRNAGPLYRSGATDQNGSFELRGVAPGSYRLFAWPELEGAAYRNADFMKQFEDGGKAVRIETPERISVDITALP